MFYSEILHKSRLVYFCFISYGVSLWQCAEAYHLQRAVYKKLEDAVMKEKAAFQSGKESVRPGDSERQRTLSEDSGRGEGPDVPEMVEFFHKTGAAMIWAAVFGEPDQIHETDQCQCPAKWETFHLKPQQGSNWTVTCRYWRWRMRIWGPNTRL